jgi:molybdate-binding protein/DNA-binding XRE family transcriptional regulator
MIMSTTSRDQNRVRVRRLARDWSQQELARRAGISRAAVSAIEGQRLVPSVAAALALAHALDCTVEELFSTGSVHPPAVTAPRWAWPPLSNSTRYWCGSVQGHLLFFPAEATPLGQIPHDGIGCPESNPELLRKAEGTLIMASCDPAVGLLARLYERTTGYRLLVFPRSSRQALELLEQGLVHLAGVHLTAADAPEGNAASVQKVVSEPTSLLRVASWQDGVAVASNVGTSSIRNLLRDRLTWIGREQGSGARKCLDQLLHDRPAPRRLARDHRGVAEAIRCGWADAGVCVQLVAEEAGLRFLPVQTEGYDLCFKRTSEDDPRVLALVGVIRSLEFRKLQGELPGYDCRRTGEQTLVK